MSQHTTQPQQQTDVKVVMNNRVWTEQDKASFNELYGITPAPGNYWYDKLSGMYGVMGQPAAGFLRPGHDFGDLPANASGGNTKVYFNNRELSQLEYVGLCALVGTYVMPGHYWLDAHGNAGIQGSPFPLVNLFMASRQQAYGAGGGDNFWSSRYGAGNSDSTGGYVSVDGYGPIGYGSCG